MTQTLPVWLPAVIAGGLVAAADWLWPQDGQEGGSAPASRPQTPTGQPRRVQPLTQPHSPRNTEPKEQAMPATHTRTHVYVSFANPFLVCDLCQQPATRWHDHHKCGCDTRSWIDPCGHNSEAVSTCPSWSPLDGCLCQEFLGRIDHAPAPTTA